MLFRSHDPFPDAPVTSPVRTNRNRLQRLAATPVSFASANVRRSDRFCFFSSSPRRPAIVALGSAFSDNCRIDVVTQRFIAGSTSNKSRSQLACTGTQVRFLDLLLWHQRGELIN